MGSSRIVIAVAVVAALSFASGCARRSDDTGATGGRTRISAEATAFGSAATTAGGTDAASATGALGSGGTGASGGSAGAMLGGGRASTENPERSVGENLLVYVVNNSRSKTPSGTVIVLGDSVYEPGYLGAMGRGELGPLAAGQPATLVVFPDGRHGKKIRIPILVPVDAAASSRPRIVEISISDTTVLARGVAVVTSRQYERF